MSKKRKNRVHTKNNDLNKYALVILGLALFLYPLLWVSFSDPYRSIGYQLQGYLTVLFILSFAAGALALSLGVIRSGDNLREKLPFIVASCVLASGVGYVLLYLFQFAHHFSITL